MLVGYKRLSRIDRPEVLDVQRRALLAAGVTPERLYEDSGFGRSGLERCLNDLRKGDVLVVWKLDRLGRGLRHLVSVVDDLTTRGVGLKVLSGEGAAIDTTAQHAAAIPGIFSALVEFEQSVAAEYVRPGAKPVRMRKGGPHRKLTPIQLRAIQLALRNPETNITRLCEEMGISRPTLYRHVGPDGELRPHGVKLLRNYERDHASGTSDGETIQ